MKQNLILVVILLATLLMVNAIPHHLIKRDTTFGPCNTTDPTADPTATPPPELTVTVSPDPPVPGQDCTFTITGSAAIAAGDQLVVSAVDSTGAITIDPPIDICSTAGVTCPADTLSITATATIPAETGDFGIIVIVGDASNNTLGCATGIVSTAATA